MILYILFVFFSHFSATWILYHLQLSNNIAQYSNWQCTIFWSTGLTVCGIKIVSVPIWSFLLGLFFHRCFKSKMTVMKSTVQVQHLTDYSSTITSSNVFLWSICYKYECKPTKFIFSLGFIFFPPVKVFFNILQFAIFFKSDWHNIPQIIHILKP